MADPLYAYQRWMLAQRWEKLSVKALQTEIEHQVKDGNAKLIQIKGDLYACSILGRRATSTSGHVDWKFASATRNWIKACLKNDAPEVDT